MCAAPTVYRMREPGDLGRIPFQNGIAAVEVPIEFVSDLPIRDFERGDSTRLAELERSIREKGWQPLEPIIVRVGRKGRWVVVDGGHRLTALFKLRKGIWRRLIGPRVDSLYFVLFLTPDSWRTVGGPPQGIALPTATPEELREVQGDWESARVRADAVEPNPTE